MTPERVLTLCVGISVYDSRLLEPGEKPLAFLASSATELSTTFRSAWTSGDSRHLVTLDGEATSSRVKSLIERDKAPYGLFVLYLGGHGRIRDGKFQFVFSDDGTQSHLASSASIDEIAGLPKAKHVLLFLDACYAGRYIEETSFFRSIAADRARICVASSLPDQTSWEDAYFKRSLFAHAVIKALTVPPGIVSPTTKRVDAAFDEIAQDVVRHAFALKRSAQQEPAMTGALTVPLSLPLTARTQVGRAAMTTYQTLLRRSRQIGIIAACIAVIAISIVSAVTWRPALNGSGLVEIRPGPKWLSPLNLGPWRLRVETESSTADLKDERDYPSVRAEIRDEEGIHVWLGSGRAVLRRWADYLIDEHLSDVAAARWRVRLGYPDAVEKLTAPGRILHTLPTTPLSTATRLAAEAKALAPGTALSDVWTIQWQQRIAPGTCDESVPSGDQSDLLSFYLSSEPAEILDWLRGIALTARVDDAVGIERVVALVKMFSSANRLWKDQYAKTVGAPGEPITGRSISARFNERPTPGEISAMAAIVTAIVERRIQQKVPVTAAERQSLIDLMTGGCSEVGVHVLAAAGPGGDPDKVITWARTRNRADQGRLPLLLLASRGALPPAEVTRVLLTLGFDEDAAGKKRAFVYAREWLSSIAEVMSLPPDLLHAIVEYATQRHGAGDDAAARDAAFLLARSFSSIPANDRLRVLALLEPAMSPSSSLPPTHPTIERLGLLALTGTHLTAEQRSGLMGIIEASDPYDPSRISFVDADRSGREDVIQLVTGLTSTHLLAFSRFVAAAADKDAVLTDPRTVPFLEQALADGVRSGVRVGLLRTVVAAAARARRASGGAPQGRNIIARLRQHSDDAAKRFATSAVAIVELGASSVEQRNNVIDRLRVLWAAETEPEIKLSLAAIIIGVISPPDALPRPTR
jgi:Caspase domain